MRDNSGKYPVEVRIAETFKNMLCFKNPDKISVREIAQEAGVIRATFYNHFSDKAELVKWILMSEMVSPVMGLFENGMYKEAAVLIFQNMRADAAFYEAVRLMTKPVPFREIVDEAAHDLIAVHMRRAGTKEFDHPWLTIRMVEDLYANMITFIVMKWIEDGMRAEPEELAKVFEYLATRTLWDILTEVEGNPDLEEAFSAGRPGRF